MGGFTGGNDDEDDEDDGHVGGRGDVVDVEEFDFFKYFLFVNKCAKLVDLFLSSVFMPGLPERPK